MVDRTGRTDAGNLVEEACDVAGRVMAAVPAFREWDGWAVHVYDARGEIAVIPFAECEAWRHLAGQKISAVKTGSTDRPQSSSNRRKRVSARVSPVSMIASSGSRKRVSSRPASSR